MMPLKEKLMRIQTQLKAPKNLYNSFGKYKYRNAEGICEAVKPYLEQEKVTLILSDEVTDIGGRIYVKATARLADIESNAVVDVTAYAREAEEKKGMDESQITGTASSYARKYALNGLFLLDDTKDADTDEYHEQTSSKKNKGCEGKGSTNAADTVPASVEQMQELEQYVNAYADMCEGVTTNDIWGELKRLFGFAKTSDLTVSVADKAIQRAKGWYERKQASVNGNNG